MLLTTLVTLALTACGGAASQVAAVSDTTTTSGVETTTSEEQPVATEPGYDAELSAIVEQVRADLTARLEVEESSIEVLSGLSPAGDVLHPGPRRGEPGPAPERGDDIPLSRR